MNIKKVFLLFLALMTALILLLSLLWYQSEKNAIPQDEVIETYKNKDLGVQFDYYPEHYVGINSYYSINRNRFSLVRKDGIKLQFYKKISEERQKNLTCPKYLEIHSPTAAEIDSRDPDCENIKVHVGFQCEAENTIFTSVEGDMSICRKIKVNGADAVYMMSSYGYKGKGIKQYLYFNLRDDENGFSELLFFPLDNIILEGDKEISDDIKIFEELFVKYSNNLENGVSINNYERKWEAHVAKYFDLFYKTFKFIE